MSKAELKLELKLLVSKAERDYVGALPSNGAAISRCIESTVSTSWLSTEVLENLKKLIDNA